MAPTAVSNQAPALPPVRGTEAKSSIDHPAEQSVAPPTPAPAPAADPNTAPASTVNTSGQTIGTTINTTA